VHHGERRIEASHDSISVASCEFPYSRSRTRQRKRKATLLGLLIVGCALLGLAVGSFLNVVIYRVPRHESIVTPRSKCPNCQAPILERDNIPVVSWLLLHAKCRNCRAPISARYPLVELMTSGLFAGAAARMGFTLELPAFLVMLACLLALSWIDAELMVLPLTIVYTTLVMMSGWFVLIAGVHGEWRKLLVAVIGAAAWFGLFFLLNFASPRYLGFGDVRLALILGLGLGWLGWRYELLGFFLANLIGAVIGIALIATKRMRRDQPIPYGVFLAIGAAIAIYAGPELLIPFQSIH
jgi:leader peptidase (prepilin peptidase)/N-methyltransferase